MHSVVFVEAVQVRPDSRYGQTGLQGNFLSGQPLSREGDDAQESGSIEVRTAKSLHQSQGDSDLYGRVMRLLPSAVSGR